MEKMKKLGSLAQDVGKTAKSLLDKTKDMAVAAVDRNDDGKFDFNDVAAAAEAVGDAVKRSAQTIRQDSVQAARERERKALSPIFRDTLDEADFFMPKLIRVTERDKRFIESETCRDAVGYTSDLKDMRIVNIFDDALDCFSLTLKPDSENDFYYADPTDRNCYIALNRYFDYLKTERVLELMKIAQELGARHFRVTYLEESAEKETRKAAVNTKAAPVRADGTHSIETAHYAKQEIMSDMTFPGHAPVNPKLKYLQKEPLVLNLVSMRLNESSPLQQQSLLLKMSTTSGIKESDAVKIDAALKSLKFVSSVNISGEVKNESHRLLKYEIEF